MLRWRLELSLAILSGSDRSPVCQGNSRCGLRVASRLVTNGRPLSRTCRDSFTIELLETVGLRRLLKVHDDVLGHAVGGWETFRESMDYLLRVWCLHCAHHTFEVLL